MDAAAYHRVKDAIQSGLQPSWHSGPVSGGFTRAAQFARQGRKNYGRKMLRGRISLFALAVALAAGSAMAQGLEGTGAQASAVATGSVTILDPIELSQSTTQAGGAVALPKSGSALAKVDGATFTLRGLGGETYNVTTPSAIDLTRSGGGEALKLTLAPSQTTGVVPGSAGAPGSTSIAVSASLPLSAGTASGTYVGRYGLTVSYP